MGRVAGVFDNPPCTPPGVDVLEEGKLTSNNVAGSSHDPLQSPAVASGAVSKPGGDAAGQDALHSAGVEGSEDSGARSKLPQPSQEEETLMCFLVWLSTEAVVFFHSPSSLFFPACFFCLVSSIERLSLHGSPN